MREGAKAREAEHRNSFLGLHWLSAPAETRHVAVRSNTGEDNFVTRHTEQSRDHKVTAVANSAEVRGVFSGYPYRCIARPGRIVLNSWSNALRSRFVLRVDNGCRTHRGH